MFAFHALSLLQKGYFNDQPITNDYYVFMVLLFNLFCQGLDINLYSRSKSYPAPFTMNTSQLYSSAALSATEPATSMANPDILPARSLDEVTRMSCHHPRQIPAGASGFPFAATASSRCGCHHFGSLVAASTLPVGHWTAQITMR